MTCNGRARRRVAVLFALTAIFLGSFAGIARAAFGIHSFGGSLLQLERQPEGEPGEEVLGPGVPQLTAGAHPDFTTTLELNVKTVEGTIRGTGEVPDGNLRDAIGYGPPGLIGNPTVVPRCSFTELEGTGPAPLCLPETQVGRLGAILYTAASRFEQKFPLFSIAPPPGVTAEFGANVSGDLVLIDAKLVNRGGTYSVALESRNVSEGLPVGGFKITLWGVPASSAHDAVRGSTGEPTKSAAPKLAFLSNPTSCPGTPLQFTTEADSWQGVAAAPASFTADEEGRPLVIGGCQDVPFEASITAQPTTHAAESPSGLTTVLKIPQSDNPNGVATSDLRDAVIRLPEGMTVNPAAANGLESCSEAQIDLLGEAPATCPQASRLGTVKIDTPLLEGPLEGGVYLARQGQNKFGSLLAIYLAIDDPATGIVLKVPGKIETGPSGQVTASFTENPQLPFESLAVELFGGERAALITPPGCGNYTTAATLTPWSGTAPLVRSDSFAITSGPGGSACPNGTFDPKFAAGTTNPVAGRFSPFVLDLSRADGTQRLATLTTTLPEGLLGKLAGIPYCPDASLAAISPAEGTAAAQVASPSCPSASQVGTVTVGAGAGSPFFLDTGRAYLAGPYKGAPLSLAIVTPALAGPFDLGNVVVRAALEVNPETTRITAVADPLPTVLHGIPIDLRDVRVDLDRPQFTVNPTSCRAMAVGASIGGVAGSVVERSVRFQVAGCAGLGFKPSLALRLSGQTGRLGNPALTAVLTQPKGSTADIANTQVILPKGLFIDQSHISNPCTRVQFSEAKCPAKSILGTAKAWSPLLAEPLSGPVYFRSNGGERKLPDIVVDLGGQIHVTLVGFVDSVKSGKEASRVRTRFQSVPDAPVSRFVLNLKGGDRGLLENSRRLCQARPVMTVLTEGQNGKVHDFRRGVATSCASAGKR